MILRSWAGFDLDRPLVMGIVNVTPDSFSDGGDFIDPTQAIARAKVQIAEGADIIDVGGETTRPGSVPPSIDEEISRILPVVMALAAEGHVVSIDTRRAAVMEAAIQAGARIINDVSGLSFDPEARAVAARLRCPVILMHMRGTPETMQDCAVYTDVIEEVKAELASLVIAAACAGVAPDHIVIDPGVGFAKTTEHSLALVAQLRVFASLGYPILLGVSRKSFIGAVTGEAQAKARLGGSVAAALIGAQNGANILRVHDVAATRQALEVWQATRLHDKTSP